MDVSTFGDVLQRNCPAWEFLLQIEILVETCLLSSFTNKLVRNIFYFLAIKAALKIAIRFFCNERLFEIITEIKETIKAYTTFLANTLSFRAQESNSFAINGVLLRSSE